MENFKTCSSCQNSLPLCRFHKGVSRGKIYYRSKCRDCFNADPQTAVYQRRNSLKSKYGLTEKTYNELSAAQDHRCAICGLHESDNLYGKLYVDHAHDTGRIRGLLCAECNSGLGKFRDNPALMVKAAEYVSCR